MGLTHIARGSIKSVQAYGLNLLGKINGHLKRGNVFYTKTCILIIYCTVPSKFPFLRMSMFTKMHWHFPEHCRIPNSTENQIGQACIFDLVTAFITHVCSISQRYITFTAKATSFKHQRNNEKYNCSSNQQRHFCNWRVISCWNTYIVVIIELLQILKKIITNVQIVSRSFV